MEAFVPSFPMISHATSSSVHVGLSAITCLMVSSQSGSSFFRTLPTITGFVVAPEPPTLCSCRSHSRTRSEGTLLPFRLTWTSFYPFLNELVKKIIAVYNFTTSKSYWQKIEKTVLRAICVPYLFFCSEIRIARKCSACKYYFFTFSVFSIMHNSDHLYLCIFKR